MKKYLFGLFMVFAPSAFCDTNMNNLELESIETGWDQHGFIFRVKNPTDQCGGQFKVWPDTNGYSKEILSIALSALHGNKKINFRVADVCRGNRNEVIAIEINN